MSKPIIHKPVPFFCGVITADEIVLPQLNNILIEAIDEIAFHSPIIDFDNFTNYYKSEMGQQLKRLWIAFKGVRDVDELVRLKWACNRIENHFSQKYSRIVNIDPGYITEAKVILATFKNFSHRIYITKSVFADIQLVYKNGRYSPNPWTFADYKSDTAQSFFLKLRDDYRKYLRNLNKP